MKGIITLIVLLAAIGIGLQQSGLFDTRSAFRVVKEPGYHFISKQCVGAFRQIPDSFKEVEAFLQQNGAGVSYNGVGVYFDDPKTVPEEKVRFSIGFGLSASQAEVIASKVPAGYKLIEIPEGTVVETIFPYRHMFSPLLGALRVWSDMERYIQKTPGLIWQGPAVEFYPKNVENISESIVYAVYQDARVNNLFSSLIE